MDKVLQATQNDLKTDLPQFQSGDTVSVGVKVIEGTRSRVQTFEGIISSRYLSLPALISSI